MKDLLLEARKRNASDLHITVGVPPIFRVFGDLRSMETENLTPEVTESLVKELMLDKHKEIFKANGEVDFSISLPQIGRFRVNAFMQRGSEACAIRVVDSEIPSAKKLGLPQSVVDLSKKKRGLILVTGPTGSGKSTTLASIIAQINHTRRCHIVTLEDPIEYLHRHENSVINQREIGLDTGSYGNALRAALRQDPDVILVGEMRDLETIATAVTAAETGHLVLSTLHTTGAVSTISRVIDVFPPHQQQQIRVQLASVLQSVISQQLLRTSNGEGRVAAFEVLHLNAAVRSLIREQKTHQVISVMQTNKRIGMQTMEYALIDLLRQGKITREQALSYAVDATSIQRRLM
jgi:twitching motility protein PilT